MPQYLSFFFRRLFRLITVPLHTAGYLCALLSAKARQHQAGYPHILVVPQRLSEKSVQQHNITQNKPSGALTERSMKKMHVEHKGREVRYKMFSPDMKVVELLSRVHLANASSSEFTVCSNKQRAIALIAVLRGEMARERMHAEEHRSHL